MPLLASNSQANVYRLLYLYTRIIKVFLVVIATDTFLLSGLVIFHTACKHNTHRSQFLRRSETQIARSTAYL